MRKIGDSYEEIAALSDVPTKTSDLTNDSGFLTSHQDISGKADKATTLSGYGITNAYTKTQVDGLIPTVPTALSQLSNDSGYIPTYAGQSTPPSSQTSTFYPAPCIWMYDDRFWLVYNRSEITIPGSPSQYVYYFIEIENTSNKVTSISSGSTNTQYPSALAVKNYVDTVIGGIENGAY